jgi:TRAP-type mannitol/chloroaromatic compound transport system substrate-binding protein
MKKGGAGWRKDAGLTRDVVGNKPNVSFINSNEERKYGFFSENPLTYYHSYHDIPNGTDFYLMNISLDYDELNDEERAELERQKNVAIEEYRKQKMNPKFAAGKKRRSLKKKRKIVKRGTKKMKKGAFKSSRM